MLPSTSLSFSCSSGLTRRDRRRNQDDHVRDYWGVCVDHLATSWRRGIFLAPGAHNGRSSGPGVGNSRHVFVDCVYPPAIHGRTPSFLSLMFEVASALGTTGYSVGNGDVLSLSANPDELRQTRHYSLHVHRTIWSVASRTWRVPGKGKKTLPVPEI